MADSPASNDPHKTRTSSADAAANQSQWYCRVFDTEFGPLPFLTLCEMIKSGQLGPDDRVRSSDTCFWQAVRGVSALEPLFKAASVTTGGSLQSVEQPNADFAPDQWFYRIDEREHGPFTLATLQDMIGSSGETAAQILVRQVGEEEWVPFLELPANSALARMQSDRALDGAHREKPSTSDFVTSSISTAPATAFQSHRSILQMVRDNKELAVAVLVWVLLNVVVLLGWLDPYSTERKYLATLRRLEGEINALQSREAAPEDWTALRASVKETLAPIVADLKKTASASNPIQQHLLWAARDQFPRLVRPRNGEAKEAERLHKNHMDFVERELAGQ